MKTSTEELRRAADHAISARGGGQQVESPASALRRFREQVEPEDVLALLERVGRLEDYVGAHAAVGCEEACPPVCGTCPSCLAREVLK